MSVLDVSRDHFVVSTDEEPLDVDAIGVTWTGDPTDASPLTSSRLTVRVVSCRPMRSAA